MTENEFLLADRIQKIKSINELYDLENNAYISFSGGKDSTVLSHLIDEALPDNKIPRVYFNTGIEYKKLVSFVERERERDGRIKIIKPSQNIKQILESYGYPFKSKEHSHNLCEWQNGNRTAVSIRNYFRLQDSGYRCCPKILMYQMKADFKLKVSDKCCYKLKKDIAHNYEKESKRFITLTGMMTEEGGQRENLNCIITDKDGKIKKFHPLVAVNKEFEEWYIQERKIELCELYYPPFNFNRTGCKGCPYSLDLQEQLDVMAVYLPEERKQCEAIWKPVYAEYRRLGYRLKPLGLFDMEFIKSEIKKVSDN